MEWLLLRHRSSQLQRPLPGPRRADGGSGGLFLLMVYKTSNGGAACVQSIRPLLFIRLFSDFLSGKKTTPY